MSLELLSQTRKFEKSSSVLKMHRAYQPTTAANNRLLKKRWDQRQYDLHRNKVADIKPQIDNKAPRTYMHMHLKVIYQLCSQNKLFFS